MRFLFDLAYLLAALAISPVVLYRMTVHKRYRAGWGHRFGNIHRKHPLKKCIWIHAVSVGEVNATRTIVRELEQLFSDFEIVFSATTDTGFAQAFKLYGDHHTVFYWPLDLSFAMQHAFHNIRPGICLLMELEVWPNFVQIAANRNVPVVVVNGRITQKSVSKFNKIKYLSRKIFSNISLVLAQTEEYASRFREIGVPSDRIVVTGSLKYDTAEITDKVEGTDQLSAQLNIGDKKLWVAGGTGNDEEEILLNVFQNLKRQQQYKKLVLAIVPRKPERFDEVARLIEQAGFKLVRYSQLKDTDITAEIDENTVVLGDTMGDLRKFYSLADIIFVGRTLVPMGGSDMMEAAALGKCTIFGPGGFNFKQTVDTLLKGRGAIIVHDKEELLETIQKCLTDSEFSAEIARNGQEVIRKNQGATKKSVEQIIKLLQ